MLVKGATGVQALTQVIIWSFLQYPHLSDQQNPKLHNHKALQAELNHLVSEMIGKTQKGRLVANPNIRKMSLSNVNFRYLH